MIEFKTEFRIEFILLGTDSRKVLEIVHGYSLKEKMHLLINAYLTYSGILFLPIAKQVKKKQFTNSL